MRLSDLKTFDPVTIQCHDNPDADAMASGFALYCFFRARGKKVRLIYSGANRITKANLKLMIEKLNIPIEYEYPCYRRVQGLLITVDCQYGTGNVTRFEADQVAVIDHHEIETKEVEYSCIRPNLGSCSTLVWSMLRDERYPVNEDIMLGTALYYGLYMDTNQFAEIYNPLDMDMKETIVFQKRLISLLRKSNLSLKELEIAGIAMIRYSYNEDKRFAVIRAEPCDPNILGLISDFLIQVDEIDTCVVYNEGNDGYKISVRSCVKEVKANEMVSFLTERIGSGGGHFEKAGGFISGALYERVYGNLHSETYFNSRMNEYFESFLIIYADKYEVDTSGMKIYQRRKIPMGYVKPAALLEVGTQVSIRTQKGDMDLVVEEQTCLVIDPFGEVMVMSFDRFRRFFSMIDQPFYPEQYGGETEYIPTIKNWEEGVTLIISDYAASCVPNDHLCVYAGVLEKGIKVFASEDDEQYMLGKQGDYLAVCREDQRHIFVMEKYAFERCFQQL